MKVSARSPAIKVAPPTNDAQNVRVAAPLDPSKFAAAKLNLVLGVGLDAELPKLALRIVSLFVGRHMHAERGGDAWPAVRTLCEELGVSSGSMVRDALYTLLERGHLVADRKAGETTRYRIADRYFESGAQPAQEATPMRDNPGGEPARQAGGEPECEAGGEPAISAAPQPARQATNTGKGIPGIESRELNTGKGDCLSLSDQNPAAATERKLSRGQARNGAAAPPGFDEFWQSFPKRVGRVAALKAFEQAVRSGATPQEITLGAMRYAAERDREPDPAKRVQYTAHPAGWLNAGRWADEAAPAPEPRLNAAQSDRPRQRPSALELAFRGRFDP
ncbi:MAG: hypothetical protein CTY36_02715 [Methylocystis sp.]|nr:MAG: hypothetical protein CTY36_02715 [Methylocystis sp.]